MNLTTRSQKVVARLKSDWQKVVPWAAWVVYLEWAVWIGLIFISQITAFHADSTADWLVASAARDGINPYADLRHLSAHYEATFVAPGAVEVGDASWIHPRTPAALLLLQPTLLLDPKSVHTAVVIASFSLLALMGVRHLAVLMRYRWPVGLLFGSLLIVSGPMLRSLQFGAWSVVFGTLAAGVWIAVRRRSDWFAGVLLGLLIGLRLFPALLILPLLAVRRLRVVWVALSVAVVLTLVGLFAFSISVGEVVEGLTAAGETWVHLRGNASLVAPLGDITKIPAAGIVAALSATFAIYLWRLASRGFGLDYLIAVTLIAMLLISPLSWEHYDIVLFPCIALFIGSSAPLALRYVAGGWLAAMTVGFIARQPWEQAAVLSAGIPGLMGRLFLLLAFVFVAAVRSEDMGVPSSTTQTDLTSR